MLFIGEDFKGNWLKYSKDFKILDESAIYLGPNGIGKTTTYKTIKANHPLLGFFSYDDCKERILKEKNKLKISIRTTDIDKLKMEKQELIESLDLKANAFKKNDITSATKASEYSNYCKDVYNQNEIGILGFENRNLEKLLEYKNETKKKFILQNVKDLKNLKIQGTELEEIRDKYILTAIDSLEKAIDSDDVVCPVCGHNHQKSILEIYQTRKKLFKNTLNKLIDKYRDITNEIKNNIHNDILEMVNFVNDNNIDETDSTNYILIGNDCNNINNLLIVKNRIQQINEQIKQLEIEQKTFFNNLYSNWDKIRPVLMRVFKEDKITISINTVEKSIILNLKREAKTYSTGELNYIVFLLNILEFEYSDKKTIIIDDPLSSFDIKKQYEIAFDIISRLINNNKTVLIFTHNINLVNIINSQRPSLFMYKGIDMIKDTLYIYDINLPKKESILNIENLITKIPKENKLKKWLELLIEKDSWDDNCDYHKVFHYDEAYTCPLNGCSNDDLVKLVEDFNGDFQSTTFEELAVEKIVYLTALRVWMEKQMKDNFNGDFNGIEQLFPKIDYYFKHRDMWINNLTVEREDLMRKKVLLNQNDHYKSQIIPFHYALSISCDDISLELLELKEMLKIPVGV